jgi:hypothetical protein
MGNMLRFLRFAWPSAGVCLGKLHDRPVNAIWVRACGNRGASHPLGLGRSSCRSSFAIGEFRYDRRIA